MCKIQRLSVKQPANAKPRANAAPTCETDDERLKSRDT
jgi:hypothetical protein